MPPDTPIVAPGEKLHPDREVPGSSYVGTMVNVARLCLERISDPRARHDVALHMSRVFSRWADEARREASGMVLPLRKAPERRTPSGMSQVVSAIFEEAKAPAEEDTLPGTPEAKDP